MFIGNNIKGLIKLLIKLLLSIFVVMLITFVGIEQLSGDMADIIAGTEGDAQQIRIQLGLNKSAISRFFWWVGAVVQGDFGNSLIFEVPVVDIVNERIAISAPIALFAFLISILLGLLLGIISVVNNNTFWNNIIILMISFPVVWLSLLSIMIFSLSLNILPSGGVGTWQHYLMPCLALGISQAGIFARYVRIGLLEIQNSDFIHFYQVVGFSKVYVLLKYGLPAISGSLLSVISLQIGFLFTGIVVVEHIFAMPGIGDLLYQAILKRDIFLAGYIVMKSALFIILINSIVDFTAYIITPSLRKGYNA